MINKITKKFSRMQIIALGFLSIIIIGTLLLMLPFASKDGHSAGLVNALFTATSATCVTGLVVFDTFAHWTVFGQVVILILIQVGGLGFVTLGMFLSLLLKRKIGLSEREMLHESVSAMSVSGMVKLTKEIIVGTICIEGIGAIILSLRFIKDFGIGRGIYYGIFHSISAFCNAGFDLIGIKSEYSSFTSYVGDPVVNITIIALIIIGGIGFLVWDDILKHKLEFKKYMLHTKLVLVSTAALIIGGTILFFIFEYSNTLEGMPVGTKILASLFSSVTPRTAGFNTIDTGMLSDSSKLLTMLLMFIGGSPGSTAGGIKTTTALVIFLTLVSSVRKETGTNVFSRRIELEAIRKATMVFFLSILMVITASLIICSVQNLALTDVLFESFSAMGTVGMTTGITRELNTISRIVIILLMYSGRIGSLTFALSFGDKRIAKQIVMPSERINIG